jgi:uncharacterized protein (DUF1697 family)
MTGKNVALLRGINVGSAKAIPMADLARVFENLGATAVKTVLRSGNVVFAGALSADAIERAVLEATGVQSSVLVLDGLTFRRIAEANPLIDVATDGSKSFVTFFSRSQKDLAGPDVAALAPEIMVIGDEAIYQWMPDGSLQTRVPKSFWRQVSGHVTARNWNTVQKLLALLES